MDRRNVEIVPKGSTCAMLAVGRRLKWIIIALTSKEFSSAKKNRASLTGNGSFQKFLSTTIEPLK